MTGWSEPVLLSNKETRLIFLKKRTGRFKNVTVILVEIRPVLKEDGLVCEIGSAQFRSQLLPFEECKVLKGYCGGLNRTKAQDGPKRSKRVELAEGAPSARFAGRRLGSAQDRQESRAELGRTDGRAHWLDGPIERPTNQTFRSVT